MLLAGRTSPRFVGAQGAETESVCLASVLLEWSVRRQPTRMQPLCSTLSVRLHTLCVSASQSCVPRRDGVRNFCASAGQDPHTALPPSPSRGEKRICVASSEEIFDCRRHGVGRTPLCAKPPLSHVRLCHLLRGHAVRTQLRWHTLLADALLGHELDEHAVVAAAALPPTVLLVVLVLVVA